VAVIAGVVVWLAPSPVAPPAASAAPAPTYAAVQKVFEVEELPAPWV